MPDRLVLNVPLLRRRVPNLTAAGRAIGLRSATVSDLCTGKIPLGRAQIRTLVALADLAGCRLDDLVLRDGLAGMVETGVKTLDLFAPLMGGGTAGIVSRRGLGQLVFITELMRRLHSRYDFETLLWLPTEPLPAADEVLPYATMIAASAHEARTLASEALAEHNLLVVADRETVLSGEFLSLREELSNGAAGRPIFALFDLGDETPDIEGSPYGPLDSLWRIDLDLAVRKLYPAIDPLYSTSVLHESTLLDTQHLRLASKARALLRRYRELRTLVAAAGMERLPQLERTKFNRGKLLEAFLTQPLYVAEQHTGRVGCWVSLSETLDGVRRILDGSVDDTPAESFQYIGSLRPAGTDQ